MPSPLAYLNGQFLPVSELGLGLDDGGFIFGATVVDTARTFGRRPFRWPEHLARLRRDCAACYIPLQRTEAELTEIAERLLAENGQLLPPGGEFLLTTFATPGRVPISEDAPPTPTLGMTAKPLSFARYRSFFTDGITLAIAGRQSSAPDDLLPPTVKHRSRMHWWVADQMVRSRSGGNTRPGTVPLVLTTGGIGDTAIGSVLVVSGGMIHRAPSSAVQTSISGVVVEELARAAGLRVVESDLDLTDPTLPITEILLAGTGFCVAGSRALVGLGWERVFDWPGPVSRQLLGAWSKMVGLDIEGQMVGASG